MKTRQAAALAAALTLAAPAMPQRESLAAPRPPAARPVALVHARVETVSDGVIEDATVVIRDGKIAEVGKGLAAPAGARVVDVKGGTVMPGIVSPVSRLGLLSGAARDEGERPEIRGRGGRGGRGGGPPSGGGGGDPSLRAIDEVPALEDVYALTLGRAGVTTLGLAPFGNGIAGQGSAIRPRGEKRADMSVSDSAFLWVAVETETQALESLKRSFEDAKKEIEARKKAKEKEEEERKKKEAEAAAAKPAEPAGDKTEKKDEPPKPPGPTPPAPGKEEPPKGGDPPPPAPGGGRRGAEEKGAEAAKPAGRAPEAPRTDPRKEPLIAVIEGRLPLFLKCDRSADLLHFLEIMKEIGLENLKPVVVGGADLDRAAQILDARDLHVILSPDVTNEPNTRNRLLVARVLHEAGVPISFYAGADTLEAHRSLLARAADAVRFGLPRDVALRALTLGPAERLGVASRVGSVAPGKDANLIVTDGDPLDARSRVLAVYLEGVAYDPDFGEPLPD